MIIIWCVAGAIIGLIAGFSIPKTYSASVTLAPEVPNLDIMKNSAGKVQTYYVLSNNSGTVYLKGYYFVLY